MNRDCSPMGANGPTSLMLGLSWSTSELHWKMVSRNWVLWTMIFLLRGIPLTRNSLSLSLHWASFPLGQSCLNVLIISRFTYLYISLTSDSENRRSFSFAFVDYPSWSKLSLHHETKSIAPFCLNHSKKGRVKNFCRFSTVINLFFVVIDLVFGLT